jgi:PAS domain S-box-containing protein
MPGVDRLLTVRVSSVRVDADGEAATLSIITDDTERRAAEDLVRRSETLLSHLVSTSPDWITLTEFASGRYAMVNPTFLATTGYRAEEVIGRTPSELGLWADATQRDRIYRMLDQHQAVQNFPATMTTRDRRRVSMLVSAARFTIDDVDYQMTSARDVTASEQARREREAILENALVGISFTRDRRIAMTNARFDEMFGWPRGALQNQQLRVVWPSDAAFDAMSEQIAPALSRGEQVDIEAPMMRRDGSTFTGRLLAKALDPTQPASGTIWLAEDVTERRLVEQALARARDEAEAANRAKSAFLANTSHEIRTPLNALVGLAQLARTPEVDDRRRLQYIEQICESADTLSAILSDILDLSKIEAGKLIVDRVAFDLRGLIGTLKQAYGALADTKGLTLLRRRRRGRAAARAGRPDAAAPGAHQLPDQRAEVHHHRQHPAQRAARRGLPAALRGDRHRRGHGRVRAVGAVPAVQPGRQLDHAQGGRHRPGLVDLQRARAPDGRQRGRQQRARQGQRVLGRPAAAAGERAAAGDAREHLRPRRAAGHARADGGGQRGQHDDRRGAARALGRHRRPGRRRPERAARDRPAHQSGNPFDIVLMDVQMPGMSGHDVTRRLRQRYDRNTLPIVALTAAALVSEREDAMAAGMNDFLTKPIDAERLRQTLRQVLDGGRGARGAVTL